jgi:DNA/RNA-binding domain of Phe-tRNA-synthetase-like protein
MYFTHSPGIWQAFPKLVAGVVVADGITATPSPADEVQALYTRAKQRLEGTDEGQLPEIEAWRRVYSQMGLKPTQYRCAAESLLRRFKKENTLPRFHPLVDICNALSLAYATPIAVYDASKITGGITVKHSDGNQKYLDFSGLLETPDKDEVIFADEDNHAHSRRWCYRQSKKSVFMPESTKALIVIEAHHDTAHADVSALMQDLTAALVKYWKAPEKEVMLTAAAPRLDF